MGNYAEIDVKRARFPVSPFVFLRYTLQLGGTHVLTARHWQNWDLKPVFNFPVLKLSITALYKYFFCGFCFCLVVFCLVWFGGGGTTLGDF